MKRSLIFSLILFLIPIHAESNSELKANYYIHTTSPLTVNTVIDEIVKLKDNQVISYKLGFIPKLINDTDEDVGIDDKIENPIFINNLNLDDNQLVKIDKEVKQRQKDYLIDTYLSKYSNVDQTFIVKSYIKAKLPEASYMTYTANKDSITYTYYDVEAKRMKKKTWTIKNKVANVTINHKEYKGYQLKDNSYIYTYVKDNKNNTNIKSLLNKGTYFLLNDQKQVTYVFNVSNKLSTYYINNKLKQSDINNVTFKDLEKVDKENYQNKQEESKEKLSSISYSTSIFNRIKTNYLKERDTKALEENKANYTPIITDYRIVNKDTFDIPFYDNNQGKQAVKPMTKRFQISKNTFTEFLYDNQVTYTYEFRGDIK